MSKYQHIPLPFYYACTAVGQRVAVTSGGLLERGGSIAALSPQSSLSGVIRDKHRCKHPSLLLWLIHLLWACEGGDTEIYGCVGVCIHGFSHLYMRSLFSNHLSLRITATVYDSAPHDLYLVPVCSSAASKLLLCSKTGSTGKLGA